MSVCWVVTELWEMEWHFDTNCGNMALNVFKYLNCQNEMCVTTTAAVSTADCVGKQDKSTGQIQNLPVIFRTLECICLYPTVYFPYISCSHLSPVLVWKSYIDDKKWSALHRLNADLTWSLYKLAHCASFNRDRMTGLTFWQINTESLISKYPHVDHLQ